MAVQKIVLFPDSGLSIPSKPFDIKDQSHIHLVQDLWDTLNTSPGVGIAAPQIGQNIKVSVIDIARTKRKMKGTYHGRIILINPELIGGSGIQIPREGCLSVPDLLANTQRFEKVTVINYGLDGAPYVLTSEGFEALALQHEMDHLNGLLFLDRVTNIKTDLFRRKSN